MHRAAQENGPPVITPAARSGYSLPTRNGRDCLSAPCGALPAATSLTCADSFRLAHLAPGYTAETGLLMRFGFTPIRGSNPRSSARGFPLFGGLRPPSRLPLADIPRGTTPRNPGLSAPPTKARVTTPVRGGLRPPSRVCSRQHPKWHGRALRFAKAPLSVMSRPAHGARAGRSPSAPLPVRDAIRVSGGGRPTGLRLGCRLRTGRGGLSSGTCRLKSWGPRR